MPYASTLAFRADLQGLRAISICLVVLAHADISLFPGGFIGVDVFFVLSGYLITGILIQEYSSIGRINLFRFITRRLKRLLPALFVMLVSVTLLSSALLSNYQLTQQVSSINYAATWTSNLFFAFSTIDYFSELKTKDLFLHTWSLGVEEQFYLIWPLIIFFILSIVYKSPTAQRRAQIFAFLVVFFLASYSLLWYLSDEHPLWSYYLMPARIWQFSLGAGAFVFVELKIFPRISNKRRQTSPIFLHIIRILGLGIILCSAVSLNANIGYIGFWALLPSIGAALIILASGNNNEQELNNLLAHPAFVWLGDRSYSWYLWHWPVLMLGFSLGTHQSLTRTIVLILLSLVLAMLSYRYIEKPFWKGKFSQATSKRIFLSSVLTILTIIWTAERFVQPEQQEITVQQHLSPAGRARSDIPVIYAKGCDAYYKRSDVVPCIFGKDNARKTVVLLGDSIAAQWFPFFPEIFKDTDWRIIVLTKSSCPMVDEATYDRMGKINMACSDWRNKVFNYLEGIRPDLIVFGSATSGGFSRDQWIEGSKRVLTRLAKITANIILLPGTPRMSFDGPSCLENNLYSNQSPSNAIANVCREPINSEVNNITLYLKDAVKNFQNARLLDLNDLVCQNKQCAALDSSGIVVFRDSQHLTSSFVLAQTSVIRQRLSKLDLDSIDTPAN